MKKTHYPNKIRSHLVTIIPMVTFTPNSTSKLRSALHIRYSIVIPSSFYGYYCSIQITIVTTVFITILTTTTLFVVTIYCTQ